MTMRDFSCFRDAAVTTLDATTAAGADRLDRSLQAATACVYRAELSSRKELLVTVTWTRSMVNGTVHGADAAAAATGLCVAVEDVVVPVAPPNAKLLPPAKTASATPRRVVPAAQAQHKMQLQTKKRGSRSFVTEAGTAVAVHWDSSDARYPSPSCPEPSAGYYVAVVADGELALLLGDAARRFAPAAAPARPQAVLLSRREQLRAQPPSASTPTPTSAVVAHSTRCRFRDGGAEHEVMVSCRGDRRAAPTDDQGEVAVSVDGRTVVEARRVGWNFRGNRTAVLADGAVVEVMWDVHDWWFPSATAGTGAGAAQFMVKARGGGGLGVWMDEEMASNGHPPAGFFLHMQCYRR